MRSYTRHQLKQDAFAETTAETLHWAAENRSRLITAGIIAAVVIAATAGVWAWVNYRNQQAGQELSAAILKYDAPIRPAGQPEQPGTLSYASIQERAKAANADFERIAGKYSFTESGTMARYFEGAALRDQGDNAAAEKQLEEASKSRHKEIASLAKLALAGVYQDSNRSSQAMALLKDLADHPTLAVSKTTAELQLASLYEAIQQPQEAQRIYQQMQKDSPTGPAGQIAAERLQALKK